MSFDASFKHVVLIEGGYSDDPADSGGETNYGITKGVARSNGYEGSMVDLPLATAKEIYRRAYWDRMKLDAIVSYELPALADKLFDVGVNVGTGQAAKWLQRVLNIFNAHDLNYAQIAEDGAIGRNTLRSLRLFKNHRSGDGDEVLRKSVNVLQGSFYFDLVDRRPKDQRFIYGWIRHRVE